MLVLFFDHSFVPPADTSPIPVQRRIFPSLECKVACHIGQQQKRRCTDLCTWARAYLVLFTLREWIPFTKRWALLCPRCARRAASCSWPAWPACFSAVI